MGSEKSRKRAVGPLEPGMQRASVSNAAAVAPSQMSGLDSTTEPVTPMHVAQRSHLEYLKQVSTVGNPPPISEQTARLAEIAWQEIWKASRYTMPVPAACTGPDGEMCYSWDRGPHHLELEIIPGRPAEFFYRDRSSEQVWGEDYEIGERLSDEAVAKLNLLSEPASPDSI
jgi:hypothetical protein